MAQEIYGVFPGSDDYSHEVVLSAGGRKYGLKLLNGASSARIIPPHRQEPPVTLEQNSWHQGRGTEIWSPRANSFYDGANLWSITQNKLHPTLLQQWYTGFRDAEMNMPAASDTHKWLPLYAGSGSDPNRRYQSVSFTASVSSNRERSFLIVRRKGTPGNLNVEWCNDSSGSPGTVQRTATVTTASAPDWVSYYMEFKPSSVLAVSSGVAYHIKIYGASGDNASNCWEVLCDSAASGKNSADNSSWSSTAWSPYYRITDEDINQRIFIFPFAGAWYSVTSRADGGNSHLYIHGCRGKATAGSSTTLTDTGAGQYGGTWTTNMWAGYKIRIVTGTGFGQVREVVSNTGTVITVSTAWDWTPSTDSEYVLYGGSAWKEITGHGLGYVSAKPVYANGIVYFPQLDTTDIRIMQLNYANANDHGFDAEDVNHNRAYFLVTSYDASLGPIIARGNIKATASGAPNGKAISIGKAPVSPSGTPVAFGTDLTFQTSILTGDNTYRITGLYDHNNTVYAAKEDVLYNVSGNVPVKITYGADASPNLMNGAAACTGADSQFYLAAEHDVFMITGGSAYPLHLPFNLPSGRSGYVMDLTSVKMGERSCLFAALDAGTSGNSSVMLLTLQDRTWHEQIRGFGSGRRIRSVAWLNHTDTRAHLAWEEAGELLYQQMPLFGTRPVKDTGIAFQHEGVCEFATIDLLNTDPKYFSYMVLVCKNLATAATAAVYGREVAMDYQLNDNIGGSTWIPLGAFGISPQDKIQFGQGSQYKIRVRLRIENNDPDNPPIVEDFGLSLFSRRKSYSSVMLDVNAVEEDEVSGEEIFSWLVERIVTADIVQSESIFGFLHNKKMTMPAEPNMNITSLNPETGFEGVFNLYMEYLPE